MRPRQECRLVGFARNFQCPVHLRPGSVDAGELLQAHRLREVKAQCTGLLSACCHSCIEMIQGVFEPPAPEQCEPGSILDRRQDPTLPVCGGDLPSLRPERKRLVVPPQSLKRSGEVANDLIASVHRFLKLLGLLQSRGKKACRFAIGIFLESVPPGVTQVANGFRPR